MRDCSVRPRPFLPRVPRHLASRARRRRRRQRRVPHLQARSGPSRRRVEPEGAGRRPGRAGRQRGARRSHGRGEAGDSARYSQLRGARPRATGTGNGPVRRG